MRFEPGVYQVYGSLWPRTHSPSEPEGSGYIRPLLFKCRELGVSIRTGTKVLRVIRNGLEGPVLGVEAERMNGRRLFIRARRGVVVATGGFGANAELVGRFAPRLGHLRSTNLPGTTGDLIAPLEDIGAAAVGMDFFQLLPGSAEDGRFIGAASTVERMIFVNRAGERFIAEDSPSSKLSAAVLAQPGGIAFPILDANGYSAMRTLSRAMFDRALMRGDAFEANSIPELASLLQIPAEALVATVEAYKSRRNGARPRRPQGRRPHAPHRPTPLLRRQGHHVRQLHARRHCHHPAGRSARPTRPRHPPPLRRGRGHGRRPGRKLHGRQRPLRRLHVRTHCG